MCSLKQKISSGGFVVELKDIDLYELLSDRVSKIIQHIIKETEEAFKSGKPYFIIRKREIQKLLSGSRGLQFIIKQLKKRYKVVEDGSWYIISPKR